jgi:simple sugar transport system permease protein
MPLESAAAARASARRRFDRRRLPLAVTLALFVAAAGVGVTMYPAMLSLQVFFNLLIDNAFLCIVAVGMTFVILSGGIDLSVGALLALTTMVSAWLIEREGWHPLIVIPLVLLMGAGFGAFMGLLVARLRLQPFLVTLAGLFLARGLCYVISIDSIAIEHEWIARVSQIRVPVAPHAALSVGAVVALVVVAAGMWIAHATEFGRTVYAIGGDEPSAVLMGLRVRSTLVGVYALSGFCSSLAGVVFTFYMQSGYGLHGVGLELDAIAAVVIGGTLLSGGVGYVAGTLLGVMMLGLIQTLIMFDGTLSSWWTRIVIGALLFAFCLLQRLMEDRRGDAH